LWLIFFNFFYFWPFFSIFSKYFKIFLKFPQISQNFSQISPNLPKFISNFCQFLKQKAFLINFSTKIFFLPEIFPKNFFPFNFFPKILLFFSKNSPFSNFSSINPRSLFFPKTFSSLIFPLFLSPNYADQAGIIVFEFAKPRCVRFTYTLCSRQQQLFGTAASTILGFGPRPTAPSITRFQTAKHEHKQRQNV
jgi:hypothetical protein